MLSYASCTACPSPRELHLDNGGEFFNAHMLRFFGEKVPGARLSRSRPYHKNDNCLLFQPVLHLVAKEVVLATAEHPPWLRRHHDPGRTPFDRLWATGVLSHEQCAQLERLRDRTNPLRLRQAIFDQLEHVLSWPGAVPGRPEDAGLTLGVYTISWGKGSSSVTLSVGELLPGSVTLSFDLTRCLRYNLAGGCTIGVSIPLLRTSDDSTTLLDTDMQTPGGNSGPQCQ